MRRLLLATFALALLALPVEAAITRGVTIVDDGYSPPNTTVAPGDTVTWTNRGQKLHTVTLDDGSYDSENVLPTTAVSHRFPTAGTYTYHCRYHENTGMRGTVVVQAAAQSTTTRSSTTTTTRRTTTTLAAGESSVTAPGETTTTSSTADGDTTTTLVGDTTTSTGDTSASAAGTKSDSDDDPSDAGPAAVAALLLAAVSGGAALAVKRGL